MRLPYGNPRPHERRLKDSHGRRLFTARESGGTLTYSQSGQTAPTSENPRGSAFASFFAFSTENDIFDTNNCSNAIDLASFSAGAALSNCVQGNFGESYAGLTDFLDANFSIPSTAVSDGSSFAQLQVSGKAGDVFFLGTEFFALAHLGGFVNSFNTLRVEISDVTPLQAAFTQQAFQPAPVSAPETLFLVSLGLLGIYLRGCRAKRFIAPVVAQSWRTA